MNTIVVWALIWAAGHSYATISNISSKVEFEALYQTIKQEGWGGGTIIGRDHLCVSYEKGIR
jgi:hypothetical protein